MTSFSRIWRFQHLKIRGKLYSSHVLCPNVAIFLKNVFIFKDQTLKKNNIERTRISMGFGRENDENVVRTRDWCGWPSSPPSNLYANVKELIYHMGGLTETVAVNQGSTMDIQISTEVNPFPDFNLEPFLFPEPGLKWVFFINHALTHEGKITFWSLILVRWCETNPGLRSGGRVGCQPSVIFGGKKNLLLNSV